MFDLSLSYLFQIYKATLLSIYKYVHGVPCLSPVDRKISGIDHGWIEIKLYLK